MNENAATATAAPEAAPPAPRWTKPTPPPEVAGYLKLSVDARTIINRLVDLRANRLTVGEIMDGLRDKPKKTVGQIEAELRECAKLQMVCMPTGAVASRSIVDVEPYAYEVVGKARRYNDAVTVVHVVACFIAHEEEFAKEKAEFIAKISAPGFNLGYELSWNAEGLMTHEHLAEIAVGLDRMLELVGTERKYAAGEVGTETHWSMAGVLIEYGKELQHALIRAVDSGDSTGAGHRMAATAKAKAIGKALRDLRYAFDWANTTTERY